MEYLDFSSVITTIRKYISDAHNMNQIDMMYQLFVSFLNSEESQDFDFDNGLVCRWFNGQAKISPRITGYYMDNHKRNQQPRYSLKQRGRKRKQQCVKYGTGKYFILEQIDKVAKTYKLR